VIAEHLIILHQGQTNQLMPTDMCKDRYERRNEFESIILYWPISRRQCRKQHPVVMLSSCELLRKLSFIIIFL